MLGKRIKEYRKKKGFSQKELAEWVGVAQTAISNWENGTRTPSVSMVKSIAAALGTHAADLLFDQPQGEEEAKEQAVIAADLLFGESSEDKDRKQTFIEGIDDEPGYVEFSKMFDLINAAELSSDIALYKKLEKVPDEYFRKRILSDFESMNKIGKYMLFKYAELMIEREDKERFML